MIDGDSFLDIVAVSGYPGGNPGGIHAFVGDGAGFWIEESNGLPANDDRDSAAVLADFNSDTNLDIVSGGVVGLDVWFGDGGAGGSMDWTLSTAPGLPSGRFTGQAAGDFNNDNVPDLLASSYNVGSGLGVRALRNNNNVSSWTSVSTNLPTNYDYLDLCVADFDKDTNLDLAFGGFGVYTPFSVGVHVFYGDGGSTWFEDSTGLPAISNYASCDIGDINGDSWLDLAVARYSGGIRAWISNPVMASQPPLISITSPTGAQNWTGSSMHTISFDLSDVEDPNNLLTFYLNYSYAGGTLGGPIAGPAMGASNPNNFGWMVPCIDGNDVTINGTVVDTDGLVGWDEQLISDVDCMAPTVLSTIPLDAEVGVALDESMVMRFSESMDTASVESSFSILPDPGNWGWSWSTAVYANDTLTGTHDPFLENQQYNVTVASTAEDSSDPGNQIVSPHLWSFTTIVLNNPPSIEFTSPSGGESWTGGSTHDIQFIATDPEDIPSDLLVSLFYSDDGGISWNSILGPVAGNASPQSWTLPLVDSIDVIIEGEVTDLGGITLPNQSFTFEIDSTPPILDSHSPWVDEGNVARNANIDIEWREGMNATATGLSFSLQDNTTWTPATGQFSWGASNMTMTFNPDADLLPNTWYTANFTGTAKDDSEPGNNLAFYSWSFSTAAVPDILPPEISNILASPDPQEVFGSVWINATIADTYGVAAAYVEVFDSLSAPIGNFSMIDGGGGAYYFLRAYDELGVHNCSISSQDNNGNWNQTGSGCSFEIVDNTPPNIFGVSKAPSPVEIYNFINISAFVTDNYAISSVDVSILMVDNYSMDFDSVSGRYYNEHNCTMLGPHDFTIWAFDTAGNWNSEPGQFNTVDTEPPQITHTSPAQIEIGSSITFQANVTDNHLVNSVWLNYTDTSGNHFNVSMSELPSNLYELTLPVQTQAGQVVYHIYAKDQDGNGAATAVLQVTVVDTVDDVAPMPPWGLTAEEDPEGGGTVLNWEEPVLNEDNSTLDDLVGYHVYRSDSETGVKTRINPVLVETTTFVDEYVDAGKTYYYWVTAIDESANESDYSESADLTFSSESSGVSVWIYVLMIVILVVVALLLILWGLRRKKGEDSVEESPVEKDEELQPEEETELE
jgi:hypothetical protein